MNNFIGIFQSELSHDYYWTNSFDKDDIEDKEFVCLVDTNNRIGSHLWIRKSDSKDAVQHEQSLPDREVYIVIYDNFDAENFITKVDFCITKEEIIKNIKANKYINGADYYTIGQAMYTTKVFAGFYCRSNDISYKSLKDDN